MSSRYSKCAGLWYNALTWNHGSTPVTETIERLSDAMEYVGLHEYVREILKTADYRKDPEIGCVVAVASALPGCMTQGADYEEARENLIDAIELWVTVGLREGEDMPVVNGVGLATAVERSEQETVSGRAAYA